MSVSLRTYALAVMLSPSLLQTSTCGTGDTTLSLLEFEVAGQNQLAFVPGQRSYDISTTSDTAIVRTQSTDPAAQVSYEWSSRDTLLGGADLGVGGGEVTLNVPFGRNALWIYVRPPEGATGLYALHIDRAFPCTEQGIVDAIAAGGGPHFFACDGPTTVVTAAEIVIDNDVILDGEENLTLDGDRDHRVISVGEGVTAVLQGLTVTRGLTRWFDAGGGIFNAGDLILVNSIVRLNVAEQKMPCSPRDGPCGGLGGGIGNQGELVLLDSTVSGNTAIHGGGIISGDPFSGTNSTVSVTLTHSTVSGNAAVQGGGILNDISTMSVTNSTVWGNTAQRGAAFGNAGTLTIENSTVSGNPGPESIFMFVLGGALTVTSSLIDGSCAGTGSTNSGGYNIESLSNTCGFDQATDQVNVSAEDLRLGTLADNGGPTETHALMPGSVAIDRIPPAMCEVDADQRGVSRPQGNACDVGAFELEQ